MEQTIKKITTSPRDFFLYIGVIVALYISTISVLRLLFEIIDRVFPDPLEYYVDPYSGGIRFAIASLVILYPAYVFVMRFLHKDMQANPEKRELRVRKWLVYLTLFITGAIIIGDLIALINTFLGGELTTRFMFKVIAVLAVTGTIFGYYVYDLKWVPQMGRKTFQIFAWGTSLFVLLSIVFGFMLMGSPSTQRLKRLDADRVFALQSIQWQIVNYWQQKEELPKALDDLEDTISGYIVPVDPSTGESYVYDVIGERTFRLCATFELPSEVVYGQRSSAPVKTGFNETWEHEKGETCFEREVDPDLYPPRLLR